MKHSIVILLIICLGMSAKSAEIAFMDNPDWGTVLKKAKAEQKLIFLDAYATWCGPCKKMDSDVYTDQAVADWYNTRFINVKYDMERGEGKMLAEKYSVTAYPTLMFIDWDGKMVHKGMGYKEPLQFIDLGKVAANPETQYTTIKARAAEMSPADFLKFAATAEEVQDSDFNDIAKAFLLKQPDVLASKEMIDVVMKAISYLPDEKTLAYIVQNQAKISQLGEYSAEEVKQRIIGLTLTYAVYTNTNEMDGELDEVAVKQLLQRYIPENAYFIFKYFSIENYLEREEGDKAMAAFNELLTAGGDKISYEEFCNIIIAFGASFSTQKALEQTFAAVDAFKLKPADSGKGYLKDFVKAVVYLKLKDREKFKTYATALLGNSETPEQLKSQLKGALEQN